MRWLDISWHKVHAAAKSKDDWCIYNVGRTVVEDSRRFWLVIICIVYWLSVCTVGMQHSFCECVCIFCSGKEVQSRHGWERVLHVVSWNTFFSNATAAQSSTQRSWMHMSRSRPRLVISLMISAVSHLKRWLIMRSVLSVCVQLFLVSKITQKLIYGSAQNL